MTAMAKVYEKKIIIGEFFFSDLPEKYIDDVKILLREDVANEVITPDQYYVFTGEPYEVLEKESEE